MPWPTGCLASWESVLVFDQETLAYWERSRRSALDNIAGNPQVVIFYNNPEKRIRWRFNGTATVYEHGEIRDKVMSRTVQGELDRDPERQGVAVPLRDLWHLWTGSLKP